MKTTEQWENVERIFHAALDRAPAERAAFLAEACAGDAELLDEVRSLLAAHERTGNLIDSPAYALAAEALADGRLRLAPGQQLGPYRIIAKLGAGGMGEVYRARDTRLARGVAIKVLPSAYAGDADRMRRFEQEARAAGALNHPNVLGIFDVGNQEGLFFVVSELLEGETLRKRLGRSSLHQRKAVDYSLQIAHGLAAAHEKGIVHRDLKPENVFITNDGRLKILDFGLAKLMPKLGDKPKAEGSGLSTVADTEPGVIVGTVGYMSPEQVRGERVDHRSDIFSFGSILYEMLTGKRAFQGNSAVETMNAILKDEPPELSHDSVNVSPALEKVVQHCLEKNIDERFQSARDIAFAIDSLSGISGSGSERIAVASVRSKKPWLLPVVLLTLIALVGLGFLVGWRVNKSSQPPSFQQLTFRNGTVWTARFAPDGQTIYYGAAWEGKPSEIFITRTDSPESRAFAEDEANILSFSSHGDMALLLHPRSWSLRVKGTLAVMPIAGGSPREILDNVEEADWSPDGKDLAVIHWVDGRCRLEFPIGNVLYQAPPGGCIYDARFSPKGDLIAFSDHPVWGDTVGELAVTDLKGNKKVLGKWPSIFGLAWYPTGEEIWCSGSETDLNQSIFATSLSGKRRAVASAPGTLKLQDISRGGDVLVTRESIRVPMIGYVADKQTERDLSWLDASMIRDISADGKMLLFDEEGIGGGRNPNDPVTIYLRKTDGSPAIRIGEGDPIALSPDGKWVLARNRYNSELSLLPTGVGSSKRIPGSPIEYSGGSWLPDSNRLLLTGKEQGHDVRSYIYNIENGMASPVTPEGVRALRISADGKSIIIGGRNTKRSVYSLADGEPRPIPGLENEDRIIAWSADGASIYVDRFGEMRAKVFRIDLKTGRRELWKEIAPADLTGATYIWSVHMTPDARSYAYCYFRQLSELYLIEGAS